MVGGVFEDGYPQRPSGRVPLGALLHAVIDRIETTYGLYCYEQDRPVRSATGIVELDLVLGGGVALEEVVVVAADSPLQMRAITASVARSCRLPALYAVEEPVAMARLLLAGDADVPEVLLRTGMLSERDWRRINAAIAGLAAGDIHLTAASSLDGLVVACDGALAVLVVDEAERFGEIELVVDRLRRLAGRRRVAVLATTGVEAAQVQDSVHGSVRVVGVAASNMGAMATLIEPGTLAVASAAVGMFAGQFGTTDQALR